MTLEQVNDALVRLTPGGSEFHGSPKNCLTWIKDRVSMTGKLAAQRNRYRTTGDELAAACEALAQYRQSAGAVGFQLEKLDDYLRNIDTALRRWREATE
jgi:hypothetical protein